GISAPPRMPNPQSPMRQQSIYTDVRQPTPKDDLAGRRGVESRCARMEVLRPVADNVANCVSTAEEQWPPPVPLGKLVQSGNFASACVLALRRRASTGDARHLTALRLREETPKPFPTWVWIGHRTAASISWPSCAPTIFLRSVWINSFSIDQ